MKIKNFYFSSTGNTLWVLKQLTKNFEQAGHEVQNFDVITNANENTTDCDILGIVYPVWGSTLPYPLRDLVYALPESNGQKVILIGNAGAFSGDTGIHWKNVIEKKGYDVIYVDHVFMPVNSVFPGFDYFRPPSPAKKEKMVAKAETDIKRMCDEILQGKRKYRGRNILAVLGGHGQRDFYDPIVDKFKKEMYIDQERCTSCQLCYRTCPVEAIHRSEDHKQLHINTDECIMCLKCYNLCPVTAALMKPESTNTKRYTRYKGLDKSVKPILYR
jgi:formate hydrogenlyase subunit 6/NADH:ubiquinone oxidoreductase subunit I/flavodoxin